MVDNGNSEQPKGTPLRFAKDIALEKAYSEKPTPALKGQGQSGGGNKPPTEVGSPAPDPENPDDLTRDFLSKQMDIFKRRLAVGVGALTLVTGTTLAINSAVHFPDGGALPIITAGLVIGKNVIQDYRALQRGEAIKSHKVR